MKDITIVDVAKEADVSPATVSRVLNNTVLVSSEKQKKVEEAVEKLGYNPNKFARALRKQRSETVGIVVPDVSNPYFATLIRGAETSLHGSGRSVLICDTDSKLEQEGEYISTLLREQVDGVILVSSGKGSQQLKRIREEGISLVAADRDPPLKGVSKVLADNHKGGIIACNHLVQQGYKKVGFIKGPPGISTAFSRFEGFKEALQQSGQHLDEEYVFQGDFSFEAGRKATKKLLSRLRKDQYPFGLVAADDLMALGAMREVSQAGISIPQEFGVVGFDNILMAKLVTPSLTTISIPAYQIGEESAKILVEGLRKKLEGSTPTITKKVFDIELISRESSLLGE